MNCIKPSINPQAEINPHVTKHNVKHTIQYACKCQTLAQIAVHEQGAVHVNHRKTHMLLHPAKLPEVPPNSQDVAAVQPHHTLCMSRKSQETTNKS